MHQKITKVKNMFSDFLRDTRGVLTGCAMEKVKHWCHAKHPRFQRYDEVHIVTIPRFKGGIASEWRHHAQISFKRKGKMIRIRAAANVDEAMKYLPFLADKVDDACFHHPENDGFCDQEG